MINNIKVIGIIVEHIAHIISFKCFKILFHLLILFFCRTLTLPWSITSITWHSLFLFGLSCHSLENVTIHTKYILWLIPLKSCCFGLFGVFELYCFRLLFLKLIVIIFVFMFLIVEFLCFSMALCLVITWF